MGSTSLREWGVHREESCFHVGAVYYLRVTSKPYIQSPCRFKIVFRITRVPAQYLYLDKKVRMASRDNDVGIVYYRVNIPKEVFVDVQSVTVTMTELQYTCIANSQPNAYCMGFDVYMGKQQSAGTDQQPARPQQLHLHGDGELPSLAALHDHGGPGRMVHRLHPSASPCARRARRSG